MHTLDSLIYLKKIIYKPILPKAKGEWGGAGVAIRKDKPVKKGKSFYHEPRYVITQYSHELSWLFMKLMRAFNSENRLDHINKIEFFGRLANAANRCINNSDKLTPHILYSAVLHEAFLIYEEMENKEFEYLCIARDNEIYNDRF